MLLSTELLQQYCVAMQKESEVRSDYDGHMQYLQSQQMKQKQQELHEQERELRHIEKTLGESVGSCM